MININFRSVNFKADKKLKEFAKKRIEKLGVKDVFISKVRSKRITFHRVRVGPVKTPREYEDAIKKLSSLSLDINLISD